MADQFQDWLATARKKASDANMSPEEGDQAIAQYLVKGGWKQEQVTKALSPQATTPQSPEDPGFLKELYNVQLGGPLNAAYGGFQAQQQGGAQGLQDYAIHAAPEIAKQFASQYTDQGKQIMDELQGKDQRYQHPGQAALARILGMAGPPVVGGLVGGPIGAAAGALMSPLITQGAERIGQGQPGAGVADMTSGISGGIGGEDILSAAGAPTRDALAPYIYRKGMGFPTSMSRKDVGNTVSRALEYGLTTGNSSIAAIGHVNDPGTLLGNLSAQTEGLIQAHKNTPVQWQPVVDSLQNRISRARMDPSLSGRKYADGLQKELDGFQQNVPTGPLLVPDAQNMKKAMYGNLSDSVFDDTKELTGAEKNAKKDLALGLKKAIEDRVPEVGDLNGRMHNLIDLQQHLDDIEKTHPGMLSTYATTGLGLAMGGVAEASGHPMASGLFMSGVLIRHALKDPVVASRLAGFLSNMGEGPTARMMLNMSRGASSGMLGRAPQAQPTQANSPVANLFPSGDDDGLDIQSEIQKAALYDDPKLGKIDPRLALAVARQESGMQQHNQDGELKVNPKSGATGIMQLLPHTASDLGVDESDALDNIKGGVTYLKQMLKKYGGNTRKALAAYNFGPGNVDAGKEWPPETQQYVENILKMSGSK